MWQFSAIAPKLYSNESERGHAAPDERDDSQLSNLSELGRQVRREARRASERV
jgi:hypothetical protein